MIDSLHASICALNVDYAASYLLLNTKIMVNEIYAVLEGAQRGVIDPRMLPLATMQDMAGSCLTQSSGKIQGYFTLCLLLTSSMLIGNKSSVPRH